jgi:hypothetical protein
LTASLSDHPSLVRPSREAATATSISEQAQTAANSRVMEALGRTGLTARGLIWMITASIAAQIALGHQTQTADQHGAIEDVAAQPLGRVLLLLLVVGFAGYALWRWSSAATGISESQPRGPEKLAEHATALVAGLVYAGLCATTVLVLAGHSPSSSSQRQETGTARLLGLPLGRPLVIVVGLGVLAGGGGMIWWAARAKFKKRLALDEMRPRTRSWVVGLGIVGNAARGCVLLLVGGFLVKAASAYDPRESKGLDQTLRTLAAKPYGAVLLLLAAVGLFTFGLYSFVEARYRHV